MCIRDSGKAEEIRQLIQATEAGMAIFDNPLSPSQIRVLEELLGVTVLDRSALILDIFAQRAKNAEGRLQVELAQYKYCLLYTSPDADTSEKSGRTARL